jgi:hypothetical protein
MCTKLQSEILRGEDRLENLRVDMKIKMYLTEIGCDDEDWIYLAQDRIQLWVLVNAVMSLRVPQKAGYFLVR